MPRANIKKDNVVYPPVTYGTGLTQAQARTNTTIINNTLISLSNSGGGILRLLAGTIQVAGDGSSASNGAILQRDNTTIRGSGLGNTIIQLVDDYTSTETAKKNKLTGIIRTPSAEINRNCLVEDLTIDGNRHNQTLGITSISVTSNVATITTDAAHNTTGTNTLYIEGADEDVINGFKSCTVTGANTLTFSVTSADGSKSAAMEYTTRTKRGKQAITSITVSSNVATVEMPANHDLETGDLVVIMGCSERAINGAKYITKVDADTFTFAVTSADGSKTAGLYYSGLHDAYYCGVTPASAEKDTDITLRNVEIKSCSQYGCDPHEQTLRFVADYMISWDNALDGCVADYLVQSDYKNLHLFSNGRHGLNVVTTTTGLTIQNLKSEANGWGNGDTHGNGLTVQNGSNLIELSNFLSRYDYNSGMTLNDCQNLIANGMNIEYCGEHGILLEGLVRGQLSNIYVYNCSQLADNSYDGIVVKDSSGTDSSRVSIDGFTVSSDATNKHRKALREDINDATDCYYSNGFSVGNQADQAYDLDGLNTIADNLCGELTTTNASAKTILQLETPSSSTSMCVFEGVNYNTTDNAGSWFKIIHAVANIAGTTSLLGSADSSGSFASTDIAAIAADDSDDTLDCNVTGIASKTINWKYNLSVRKVS